MAIDTTTSVDVQTLTPFKKFIMTIGALPTSYLESMTYAELLMWFCNYLQETVIPTVNNNAEAVEELQGLYEELRSYVNDYFDNLDVTDEINAKLDEMAEDGSLGTLIGNYINPLIAEQNNRINEIDVKVDAVTSGSPLAASSTAGMTDTNRIYVNTSDGYWYYYNGTNWVQGGVYQSTVNNDVVDELENLITTNSINLFDPLLAENNIGLTTVAGTEVENTNSWVSDFMPLSSLTRVTFNYPARKICVYDENKAFLATTEITSNLQYVVPINSSAFTGGAYVRVMVMKADCSFENRFNFCFTNEMFLPLEKQFQYKQNDTFSIKESSINLNNLNNEVKQTIAYNSIMLSKNPLKLNDFVWGTYSSGSPNPDYRKIYTITKDYYYIPQGTVINQTNTSYVMILFVVNADGSYSDRVGAGTYSTVTVPNDGYYRLVMRKADNTTATESDIEYMIAGLQFVAPTDTSIGYTNNYNGEKIDLFKYKYKYSTAGFSGLYQDGCQYNGTAFLFNNQGEFKVVNLTNNNYYTGFYLDEYDTIKPHCNCVCFSHIKYDEDDPFPLLYVNAYNNEDLPKGTCYVHRILKDGNNYSTDLIQTISIGFTDDVIWKVDGDLRDYGNFLVDTDNNHLIVYTLRNNKTRFFIFNLPSTSSSTVTLAKSDILEYFDCDYFNYIQGGHYQNGKVYSLDGITTSANLHVFDLNKKALVSSVNLLSLMSEPEFIFEKDGALYIGESTGYKFNF